MFIFGTLWFRAATSAPRGDFIYQVFISCDTLPHENLQQQNRPKNPTFNQVFPERDQRARSPHGGLAVLRQHERGGGKPRRPARRNGSR